MPAVAVQDLILALALPEGCRVDQRVPKKLLVENGAATSADKRLINDGIEDIQWVAALKPNTIGVPAYRDDLREYLEIAVLAVTPRAAESRHGKDSRLAELVHRAVPYPVLLLLDAGPRVTLSLAHKRWSHNEAGKVVLDDSVVAAHLPDEAPTAAAMRAFMDALALTGQPRSSLYGLYQGWMDSVHALLAAKLTGNYQTAQSPEHAVARRQALQACQRLEQDAARLRAQAAKEKRLARQVELNLALKQVQHQLAAVREQL
jgi:hypothetical protein